MWGKPLSFITGRNEVVAKVIFLHLSVILFTGGGCLPHPPWGADTPRSRHTPPPRADNPLPPSRHPPGADAPSPGADTPQSRPPRSRPPWEQMPPPRSRCPPGADTPPRSRHPPRADIPQEQTPPQSRLRYTVNERPVRILLECILVFFCTSFFVRCV